MTREEDDAVFGKLRGIAIRLQRKLKFENYICDDTVEMKHEGTYRVLLRDSSGLPVQVVTLDQNENVIATVELREREKPEDLIELIREHHKAHPNHVAWVRQLMRLTTLEKLPEDVQEKTELARRICARLGLE